MRVIFLSDRPALSRVVALRLGISSAASVALLLCMIACGAAGYWLASPKNEPLPEQLVQAWQTEINTLAASAAQLRASNANESRAYAARMANLQARLLRMEAVGERLVGAADLDAGEFDFDQQPALGGPAGEDTALQAGNELSRSLDRLAMQIEDRERQLDVMERLLGNRTLVREVSLEGRPVASGYLSSRFGRRTDPFDGSMAWHKGVDFTARTGTGVLAVAPGVVTWAGYDKDYGKLVEIRHSDGYRTRYAHNSEMLVKPGDLIKKGQLIARVGRTGRASGTHLHFEVIADGRPVDPLQYISTARAGG